MKSTMLWALVGLNVLLAIVLVTKFTGENTAHAQAAARASDYLIIPGEVTGAGVSSLIYVLDVNNGVLGGMAYQQSGQQGRLEAMPPIDLNRFFQPAAGAGDGEANGGRRGARTR
ncbi:MAG: hypothetical protein ACREIT_12370 [Tepidisphaeraceae bacterium]